MKGELKDEHGVGVWHEVINSLWVHWLDAQAKTSRVGLNPSCKKEVILYDFQIPRHGLSL